MSAKVVIGLIVAVFLTASPTIAFYSDEYFKIVSVEEVVDGNGKVTFIGEALNIDEFNSVLPSYVIVTVKLQDVVLAVISGRPDVYDQIQPGQICPFTIETDFEQGQYDNFSIRFSGWAGLPNPDTQSLTGGLILVEESLNFTTFGSDSTAVILGELYNDTNGILTNIALEFRLFKDEDCLLGIATPSERSSDPGSMIAQDITPGSTIGFIAYSAAPLSKIGRWEYSVGFELVRLAPRPEEATALTATTWGQIKAIRR